MMTAEQPRGGLPPARRRARVVRDLAIRMVGIPFFGLVIPRVTGALGALRRQDGFYWIGTGWFLMLSLALWQGNRWLLLRRRARTDWLAEPGRSLAGLLLAHVFFSVPVTAAAMVLWYRVAPFPAVEWARVAVVTGVVLAAVLLVTHAYETMFLIRDRLEDRLDLERMERARLQAELDVMKSQLAPHFLFNCLNALGVLIAEDPPTARRYNQHMAQVCRHLIALHRRDLVPLAEERAFFEAYVALARLRFPASLSLTMGGFDDEAAAGLMIPPASLQLLLENALKHNVCNERDPLPVEVWLADGAITMRHPFRPVAAPPGSTGTGLANLRERFHLAAGRAITVERGGGEFRVTLPLVHTGASAGMKMAVSE